ncbi:hypothetical protein L7F22_001166 [Adiantum nelumboides]|nr:hypothetical protein [Adiantum nelumboides]
MTICNRGSVEEVWAARSRGLEAMLQELGGCKGIELYGGEGICNHVQRGSPNVNDFVMQFTCHWDDWVKALVEKAFVLLQMAYVLWTLFVDRRKRPSIAVLFMYTLRAFLGYATQLPVPQDFLGSGLDFPVNNTSFFLFFSGHVAISVIVCRDMRRTHRQDCGALVGYFNLLQSLRLLATRGHYTIDVAIGAGAGWACDLLAGKYEKIQEEAKDFLEGNGATNGFCPKQ